MATLFQMLPVAKMNVMEFFLAGELLLWGSMNALYATVFIALVGWHEF